MFAAIGMWLRPMLWAQLFPGDWFVFLVVGFFGVVFATVVFSGMRYIPNNRVGIVETLWSPKGSVPEGRMMALMGEAGFQADLLRGGVHFGLWAWQYRIHRVNLVTVPQGKIGYVYARDGEPLEPSQTLGRVAGCNNFQDARAFLIGDVVTAPGEEALPLGQRGRQRMILREGVYAINLALFVVITEDAAYRLEFQGRRELETIVGWQNELKASNGFNPVVIGAPILAPDPIHPERQITVDSLGIVTVQDGPSLGPGEIIAPAVGTRREDKHFHNNYQDPEAFLAAGGHRGRQYVPLTDGTYFINRWFASVEVVPKTVVPIGFVGVVVSYYGRTGQDVSGAGFRHGERVAEGERGVLERPLGPGKYGFNPYAGSIVMVPTTNFVLHWVTGRTETHRYDESLRSIDLVTKDAYEPTLPLSVVVHIDYQKAPNVIQRFGDVKKLITQTLDPMLSAFFRDVAHKRTMLQLLQDRDDIQREARETLSARFGQFDIECVDVLIGKPDTAEAGGKIETLLEQLRQRQLSVEQIETYQRQRAAAETLQTLNDAQAQATMQTSLTNSKVQIQIVENQGEAELAKTRKAAEADLARAKKMAEQMVVTAQAELDRSRKQAEQMVILAQAEAEQRTLAGKGEASKIAQIGLSEASVLLRKVQSFSDPRLYALTQVANQLANSSQPLVPQRVFMSGTTGASSNGDSHHGSDNSAQGLFGLLISLMVAEKSGFGLAEAEGAKSLEEYADKMTREAMAVPPPAATPNGVTNPKPGAS
ncbi:SPFH domain-containing protein [Singulisphaera sp. Ch08]|uniref:SPFH domain-containing protein n=1 Tax=Singulisphaera sp. Ch08 TaxID=3120278 RepID=A0AAU7CJ38_9BACT